MSDMKKAIAGNPLLILFLGACPAMGATGSVLGALGMGVAVLVVMLLSGIVISALKKAIPECARIPAYIIVITGFVSLVQMLMNAFLPDVYQMMGIYAAVAAVDLLIFGVVEESAEDGVGKVAAAALKTGLCFILALVVMGAIREVLGNASFAGMDLAFMADYKISLMTKAPGGFIVFAILAGIISKIVPGKKVEGEGTACAAAGLTNCCCCESQKEGN